MECMGENMSTNYARAKYQEIYDVNTVSNSVSIIGIHTPVGAKPRQMLGGFFTQFRKYKYLGCSVVATPAARLPLDVMNIAIEAGQTGANPKDVFNPILVRGCHGDNLNGALNSIYRGAFTDEGSAMGKDDPAMNVIPTGNLTWEQMYYRMLQDPSFKKFSMSSGVKLSGLHPMIYNVASDKQIMPTENSSDIGKLQYVGGTDGFEFTGATSGGVPSPDGLGNVGITPQFFTNRLQKLGWLDTQQLLNSTISSGQPAFTMLPKLMMAVLILPPAYRVSTAMRFVITHYFEFKDFNTSLTLEGASNYYDWLSSIVPGGSKVQNDTLDTIGADDSIEIISDGCL